MALPKYCHRFTPNVFPVCLPIKIDSFVYESGHNKLYLRKGVREMLLICAFFIEKTRFIAPGRHAFLCYHPPLGLVFNRFRCNFHMTCLFEIQRIDFFLFSNFGFLRRFLREKSFFKAFFS